MNDKKLNELKKVELEILKEFDRVCRENDIKYSIGYGTLLGAIRHKGFIPWDDDIDVMMTLEEYLKFEKIAPSKLNNEFYFQSRNINPQNYVYWNRIGLKNTTSIDMEFRKVKADWGICIDIFPIIPVSDNEKTRKKELKLLRLYSLLSLKYYHKATWKKANIKEKIKKTIHIMVPNFLNIIISKKIIKYFTKYNNIKTKKCLEYSEFSKVGYYERRWFDDYELIEFEGCKFYAIKNWDEFLTVQYGEYMKPPKDKSKHSDNPNVYIDFNKSYKEINNK